MRDYLIRLAIKYEGNYSKIRKALNANEIIEEDIETQQAITILDEDYPNSLLTLKRPPYVLFYEGNKELLKRRIVAVVGSRCSTMYGETCTRAIVQRLNGEFAVISGMARGIDAIAHQSALATIGVLGNGLDVIYPETNRRLYQQMKEKQLLITEYPLGLKSRKEHFPFRNRIIAALAQAVIVPQAQLRSGSMITVRYGLELGREIYTVPYRLTDPEGTGCNKLIQLGASVILNEM